MDNFPKFSVFKNLAKVLAEFFIIFKNFILTISLLQGIFSIINQKICFFISFYYKKRGNHENR